MSYSMQKQRVMCILREEKEGWREGRRKIRKEQKGRSNFTNLFCHLISYTIYIFPTLYIYGVELRCLFEHKKN